MARIPVFGVIRDTYEFVLANFATMFGLTWVSALLLAGGEFLLTQLRPANENLGVDLLVAFAATVLYFFFYSLMTVAVARFALGAGIGGAIVRVGVGRSELRMFRSSIILLLLTFFIGFVALFVVGIIVVAVSVVLSVDGRAWATNSPVASVVPILFLALVLAIIARCWFFLPVAAVLAPDQWIRRSYDLSTGNLWRIVAVLAGIAVPFVCLYLGELIWSIVSSGPGALHVPISIQDFTDIMKPSSQAADTTSSLGQSLLGLVRVFLSTVVWIALEVTAAVLAYRALTGNTPAATSALFD